MKTYQTPREVISSVRHALEETVPSSRTSAPQKVIDLLCAGRHYSWAGIHLLAGADIAHAGHHLNRMALPESRAKILVRIQLASHEFGVLSVESDQEHGITSEDRVLLEQVAGLLARFFAGRGKYFVRKARTSQSRTGSAASGT